MKIYFLIAGAGLYITAKILEALSGDFVEISMMGSEILEGATFDIMKIVSGALIVKGLFGGR